MTSNLVVYLLRIYQTEMYVYIHMDACSSLVYNIPQIRRGFPSGSVVKNLPAVQETQV